MGQPYGYHDNQCTAEGLSVIALTNNRLSGFGYDINGNMTSNGSTSYSYNAENQISFTSGYAYSYNGDGQRVKKCTSGAAGSCQNNPTGTLYWGSQPLLESDLGVFCFSFSSSPVITTLAPTAALAGGSQVQLTISGSDFSSNAVIILSNGALLQPSSLTSSENIVIATGTLIAIPGNLSLRVRNDCGALSKTPTLSA